MARVKVVVKVLSVIAGVVISVWYPPQTFAQSGVHGDGHAEHHDEYQHWTIPGTDASCCHDKDCRPVRAKLTEDGWQVWVGQRWMLVPWNAVLKIRAKDGRSHLCEENGMVRCFTPADPKS